MTRRTAVRHEFTDTIPDKIDDGVVYISILYATVIHLCCCGCRSQVVTPLSPTGWALIFDGLSVSLRPSVGNWSFRPRLAAPGTGRRPVLTLADRLLATILHQRLALPQATIAALFSVRAETINKRIRDIRQLLDQAGHAIHPGPHRLASLEDLLSLATAEGIITPPEIKTAC